MGKLVDVGRHELWLDWMSHRAESVRRVAGTGINARVAAIAIFVKPAGEIAVAAMQYELARSAS